MLRRARALVEHLARPRGPAEWAGAGLLAVYSLWLLGHLVGMPMPIGWSSNEWTAAFAGLGVLVSGAAFFALLKTLTATREQIQVHRSNAEANFALSTVRVALEYFRPHDLVPGIAHPVVVTYVVKLRNMGGVAFQVTAKIGNTWWFHPLSSGRAPPPAPLDIVAAGAHQIEMRKLYGRADLPPVDPADLEAMQSVPSLVAGDIVIAYTNFEGKNKVQVLRPIVPYMGPKPNPMDYALRNLGVLDDPLGQGGFLAPIEPDAARGGPQDGRAA